MVVFKQQNNSLRLRKSTSWSTTGEFPNARCFKTCNLMFVSEWWILTALHTWLWSMQFSQEWFNAKVARLLTSCLFLHLLEFLWELCIVRQSLHWVDLAKHWDQKSSHMVSRLIKFTLLMCVHRFLKTQWQEQVKHFRRWTATSTRESQSTNAALKFKELF